MGELGDRAARVCVALGEAGFRDLADDAGAVDVLERVVAALRTDAAAPSARLAENLDLLEHKLTVLGLDGLTDAERHYQPVPGAQGHPVVELWACPSSRCSRTAAVFSVSADPPWCAVSERSLRLVRLPT